MLRITSGVQAREAPIVKLICPHCRHAGAFYAPGVKDASWSVLENDGIRRYEVPFSVGVRRCPNPDCNGVVFVSLRNNMLLSVLPSPTIDFDSTNLPPSILATFEEAVKCHAAGCYKASALMVRRVLEELCEDKAAEGKNLKMRIQALSASVIIPSDLLSAADELRILGNDAAHVEAKDYDAIGQQEATLAIELTKELLKAVYQYTNLVQRLRDLKKPLA